MAGTETSAGASALATLRRVRAVARQTLQELLRLRLALLLTTVGALVVGLSLWLQEFNFGGMELKFIADFGLGVIGTFGSLLAALAMAQVFFRDLEGGMAAVVLTRRLGRGEYLAGKLSGVAAALAVFVAVLAGLLAILLAWRGRQLGVDFLPVPLFMQACAWVWLKLTLVAAMTLLVCSYAGSALFATCAGLLLTVAGHLRAFTSGDGWLGWLRVWPNLGLFDTDALLAGIVPGGRMITGLVGYWAGFVVLFTGLATYVFRRREF